MNDPTHCLHGHSLVKISERVYVCMKSNSTEIGNVWEWNVSYLKTPPSYYAVLLLCQGLVDEKKQAVTE